MRKEDWQEGEKSGEDRKRAGANDKDRVPVNARPDTSAIIFPLQLGQLFRESLNNSKLFLESLFLYELGKIQL